MLEKILNLVATVLLDLKKGCSYKKLELVLKKLENEGLFSTQITLLSDSAVSERYSSLHASTEGLAYEIIFECRSETKLNFEAKGSITHLLSLCKDLIHSWKCEDYLFGIEFSFQDSQVYNEQKRLFIFDMDSTLIQQEVIDEMAKIVGVGQQVSEITESAMRGEIDFKTSLKKRVSLLSGAPVSIFDEVRAKIEFSKGAKDLCCYLKSKGCILAVVSGGFLPLANYVKSELNLDYAFANQLASDAQNSTLTGETLGEVVTAEKKALILQELAVKHDIPLRNVVAVGDGANDLLMMDVAGLSIAFNAKPKVQEKAIGCINRPSLLNLTFFLGVKNSELV